MIVTIMLMANTLFFEISINDVYNTMIANDGSIYHRRRIPSMIMQ